MVRYIGFWSENWRPEICSVSANGQSTTWPKLNAGDLVGSETEKNLLQLSDRKMIGINAVAYLVACHRLNFLTWYKLIHLLSSKPCKALFIKHIAYSKNVHKY